MTDPFYALMLQHNLGTDYTVWVKSAAIEFVAPGRSIALASFQISLEKLAEIRAATEGGQKCQPAFSVAITDPQGTLIAQVNKLLYVRRKRATTPYGSGGFRTSVYPDMTRFLIAGSAALAEAEKIARGESTPHSEHRLCDVALLPPVTRPGKIIAVGLNYRDHAIETKQEIPTVPIIFAKFPSSIIGPDAPVVLPADDPQGDYEAELAVVIGRNTKAVSEAEALACVAGYMPLNDVSARRWQFADKQWVRGKSCDTFCPTGPWLTTRDAVPDPHALSIRMRVNGNVVQNSNTSNLIFRIPALIAFISAAITLEPGDIAHLDNFRIVPTIRET